MLLEMASSKSQIIMKKITILLFLTLLTTVGYSQCPNDDFLQLNSQAAIDQFIIDYPNCTELNLVEFVIGSQIESSPSDIVNLNGLANIETINGSLEIRNNPQLTSLDPLNDILLNNTQTALAFYHYFQNNPLITTLDGFLSPNTTILNGPGIRLVGMDGLTSLQGFENITEIEGKIDISFNAELQNIEHLSNVSGEVSLIIIESNPKLVSLSGLDGITGITEQYPWFGVLLSIQWNDLIENLDPLQGIQTIVNNPSMTSSELEVFIRQNPLLNNIDGISQLDFTTIENLLFQIRNNPNLSTCNVASVCNLIANDDNATITIEDNNTYCNSVAEVIIECNIDANVLEGEVLFDIDNNGCDPTDLTAQSVLVESTNGTTTQGAYTNVNGAYQSILDFDGTVTSSVVQASLPNGYIATPTSQNTVFTGFGNEAQADFCLTATDDIDDLTVTLVALSSARPGFNSTYRLIYENRGTIIQDGDVTFIFDPAKQTFISASQVPTTINGGVLTWVFTDIAPFESNFIDITINHLAPPVNVIGDEILFDALVEDEGDESPIDNKSILNQTLVGSFDPNDIRVAQGDEIYEPDTEKYLDYIVRFQNTGTAEAIKVRVDHVLDDELDWKTLRPLSASHSYRTEVKEGNIVSFIFDDIYLPAEQDDAEGSQGFVIFKVLPLDTFSIGDSVAANASIYFDFNEAIVTNTVTTTVVEDDLSVNEEQLFERIKIWPNPSANFINISTDLEIEEVIINTISGQTVLTQKKPLSQINIEHLSSGMYFITIKTASIITTKKIIVE